MVGWITTTWKTWRQKWSPLRPCAFALNRERKGARETRKNGNHGSLVSSVTMTPSSIRLIIYPAARYRFCRVLPISWKCNEPQINADERRFVNPASLVYLCASAVNIIEINYSNQKVLKSLTSGDISYLLDLSWRLISRELPKSRNRSLCRVPEYIFPNHIFQIRFCLMGW